MKTQPACQAQAAARGFTLMEMMAVMGIMILVMGIGFGSFVFFDEKDPFEEPVQRLTQMSKYSLNAAAIQHRGMSILFDETGFGTAGGSGPDGNRYQLPVNMKVLIKRWGGKNFEEAEGQVWRFGEQGICEPLLVRFEADGGIRDVSFHPLTGTPVD